MNRGGFSWRRLLGISAANITHLKTAGYPANSDWTTEQTWGSAWVHDIGVIQESSDKTLRCELNRNKSKVECNRWWMR